MMRSTVSVTHADTLRTLITKKKHQINTYVATQKQGRFKKQTVQLGHVVLLPDRHGPTFLTPPLSITFDILVLFVWQYPSNVSLEIQIFLLFV